MYVTYVLCNLCDHNLDIFQQSTDSGSCWGMDIEIESDLLRSFDLDCGAEYACYELTLSITDLSYGDSAGEASTHVSCGHYGSM